MKNLLKKIKQIFSKSAKQKFYAARSHKEDVLVKIDGVDVKVGKFTFGVGNINLAHHAGSPRLEIGRFCSIAGNVKIFTGAYHRTDWISTYPFGHIHEEIFGAEKSEGYPHSKGGVTIGNDVWIGNSATIMSGVIVNNGAVIAANSHVIKNVEPYEVVGGNPARHIKFRFKDEIIKELLELKWWDLSNSDIKKISHLLTNQAILQNLEKIKRILDKK